MAECLRQGFIQKWPTYVEETIGDIYVWKLYVSVAAKSTRRGGLGGGGDADQRERKSLQTAAAASS